mmetsp:Transcript_28809/g.69183  ORF Transcript_28809/g.69183 Transcript_28809/m.69183 type:complete len:328 (+) Transcript_28809:32-1015(+)
MAVSGVDSTAVLRVEKTQYERDGASTTGSETGGSEAGLLDSFTQEAVVYATGLTCTVSSGLLKGSQNRVAVKAIHKRLLRGEVDFEAARAEIAMHKTLDHPCIAPLLGAEETAKDFVLVLPLAEKGDLYQATKFSTIREQDCRNLASQILNALDYIHQRGVIHNDIKPHNILMVQAKGGLVAQLMDFGFSIKVGADEVVPFNGLEGTSGYFSPEEVDAKPYGPKADIFALGITLFQLLGGYEPFYPAQNFSDPLEFMEEYWSDVSPACISFLTQLLQMSPEDRPTASEALQHAWFQQTLEDADGDRETLPFLAWDDVEAERGCVGAL